MFDQGDEGEPLAAFGEGESAEGRPAVAFFEGVPRGGLLNGQWLDACRGRAHFLGGDGREFIWHDDSPLSVGLTSKLTDRRRRTLGPARVPTTTPPAAGGVECASRRTGGCADATCGKDARNCRWQKRCSASASWPWLWEGARRRRGRARSTRRGWQRHRGRGRCSWKHEYPRRSRGRFSILRKSLP